MTHAAETISQDIPCISCGYNLRTLAKTGRCPECGSAVAASLQSALLHWSPHHLLKLATAMRFAAILNTIILALPVTLYVALRFSPRFVESGAFFWAMAWGYATLAILHLSAAYLLCRPPTRNVQDWWPPREVCASIATFAGSAVLILPLAMALSTAPWSFREVNQLVLGLVELSVVVLFIFFFIPSLAFYAFRFGDHLAALCSVCRLGRLASCFTLAGKLTCAGIFVGEAVIILGAAVAREPANFWKAIVVAALVSILAGFLATTILLLIAASRFYRLAVRGINGS